MKKLRILLRVLTAISFFLPFTFFMEACDGAALREAYNSKRAEEIIKEIAAHDKERAERRAKDTIQNAASQQVASDSTSISTPTEATSHNYSAMQKFSELLIEAFLKARQPTEQSLSAIGVATWFKNKFGQIVVLAILIVFVVVIMPFRFLLKYRIKIFLLCLQMALLIAFITNCLASEVDMLWGLWVMTFLVLSQLALELWNLRSISKILV